MSWIYLDNNATTRPDERVIESMRPFLSELWANPSSVHHFGGQVRSRIEDARSRLAELFAARPGELVFTSGGTESDNLAVRGLLAARRPKNRLVISSVEHSAIHDLAQALRSDGVEVVMVPADSAGRLDMDRLDAAADADRTAAVSIMHANNETGVLFPIEQIGRLCRSRGVPFHCDTVQSACRQPLRLGDLPIDAASFSAHKFHGPKGVGLLYVRRGVRFVSWMTGLQERRRRGGTENVAGIIGLAAAAELMLADMDHDVPRVRELRDRLEQGLLSAVPDAAVNGAEPRLPNTSNMSFPGCQSEALLISMSEHGIAASAGAACSSGAAEPSRVLSAMGLPLARAQSAVRWSLSRLTTADEIARVLKIVPPLVQRLRTIRA